MEEHEERDVAAEEMEEVPLVAISGHIYMNGHNKEGQHNQLRPLRFLREMRMVSAVIYL